VAYSLPDLVANLRINTSQVDRALDTTERRLKSFSGFGTISVDLNRVPLVVLTTLAQQAVALTAAVLPAAGAIAAIPAAVSVASAGISTLLVGMSGLADAFKQNSKTIRGVATDTTGLKRSVEAAARGIIDAQRGVTKALREVEESNQAVIDATRGVAEAQKDAKRAQEDLNDAREQAARALKDYQNQLLGSAADEESADIARLEALKRLRDMERNRESDQLKLRKARNDVIETELRYKEAVDKSLDVQRLAAEAQKLGVEGDDRVVKAKDDVEKALLDIEAANRTLIKSNISVADANQGVLDAQEQVTLANERQADAIAALERATNKTSASQDKAAEALAALSPAARSAVKTILGLAGAWREVRNEVQEKLFIGVDKQITQLAKVTFPALRVGMGDVATSFNSAGDAANQAFSGPIFQGFLATTFQATSKAVAEFGTALEPLINGFARLSVAATPAILRFNSFTTSGLKSLAAFLNSEKGIQKLTKAIDKSGEVILDVMKIARNLGQILLNIFNAADTGTFLKNLEKITAQFAEVTASAEGQEDLKLIFSTLATISQNLAAVIPVVVKAIVSLFRAVDSLPDPIQDSVLQFAALSAILLPLLARAASLSIGIKGLIDVGQGIGGLVGKFGDFKKAQQDAAKAAEELAEHTSKTAQKVSDLRQTYDGLERAKLQSTLAGDKEAVKNLQKELTGVEQTLKNLGSEPFDVKLDVDAEDAVGSGKKSGKSFFEGLTTSINPAQIGAAILGGLVSGALIEGLAAFGATAAAAIFSIPGLIAVATVAAGILIYHFRTPIADFFTNTLPQFIDQELPKIVDSIAEFVGTIPAKSAFALGFLLGFLNNKGKELIQGMLIGIAEKTVEVVAFFTGLPKKAAEAIGDKLVDALPEKGKDLIKGFFEGILESWEKDPRKFLMELAGTIPHIVPNLAKVLADKGKELIKGFFEGIKESFEKDPKQFFLNLAEDLVGLTQLNKKAREWLYEVGKDVIAGFFNGVKSVVARVVDAGGSIADGFLGGFRKALEISSPSKVMFREGENVVDGLILGLKTQRSNLKAQVDLLANDVRLGIEPALSAMDAGRTVISNATSGTAQFGSGSAVTNNYIIQQSLVPYTPEQVADESVAALRRMELVHLS